MAKLLNVAFWIWLSLNLTSANVKKSAKYTNTWIADIKGGEDVAQNLARTLGFTYKGKFKPFEDHYELIRNDHPKVSLRDSEHLTRSLLELDEVKWAEQQKVMKIVHTALTAAEIEAEEKKLDQFLQSEKNRIYQSGTNDQCRNIFNCVKIPFSFSRLFGSIKQGNLSKLGTFSTKPATQLGNFPTKHIGLTTTKISAYELEFNDPLWRKEWYLQDYRTTNMPVMDHNVVPVYRMGYTGQGVTIAIIDKPIRVSHPDLARNIDLKKSYDMCSDRPLEEVMKILAPHLHGTMCAGVIGMVENNNMCGVGIAYNAKIAAINHDCQEARPMSDNIKCLNHKLQEIDIFSNSWGPEDDATFLFKTDLLTMKAYERGVVEGRQKKGVIYVHSAGSGGLIGDSCAFDSTINNPYVIGVTSATQYGKRSTMSEQCTAIFVTTYSGTINRFSSRTEGTVTLDSNGGCYTMFTGTSAACPVAAGIIALLLQARPDLRYRDVMHIIAMSSEVAPLANNYKSWYRNAQGFYVSNEFGFGLMNAENMIDIGKNWINVADKHTCIYENYLNPSTTLGVGYKNTLHFKTDGCQKTEEKAVYYLEHIEVNCLIDHPGNQGDIRISMQSPSGTESVLLNLQVNDYYGRPSLGAWNIVSVHNWGEDPKGDWYISIEITNTRTKESKLATLHGIIVKFHGLPDRPKHLDKQREYAAFRLP